MSARKKAPALDAATLRWAIEKAQSRTTLLRRIAKRQGEADAQRYHDEADGCDALADTMRKRAEQIETQSRKAVRS